MKSMKSIKKLSPKLVFGIVLISGILFISSSIFLLNHEVWRRMVGEKLHRTYKTRIEVQVHDYRVRQHGKYWLILNYINPGLLPKKSNENITLVTHGTYKDLQLLDELIEVWLAPVSITLFANGDDVEATLETIQRLRKCSTNRNEIKKYVTFNLCMHEDHFPNELLQFSDFANSVHCNEPARSRGVRSYWEQHQLDYPINLLLNTARVTVSSHYILPLELHYWPMLDFAQKTMQTIERFDVTDCRENVFCVHTYKYVPVKKSAHTHLPLTPYQKYAFANSELTVQLEDLEYNDLLGTYALHHDVEVYKGTYNHTECGKYFIGANKWLPLYDERITASDPYEHALKFAMLDAKQFAYMLIRGTGILNVAEASYTKSSLQNNANATQLKQNYDSYSKQWNRLLKLK